MGVSDKGQAGSLLYQNVNSQHGSPDTRMAVLAGIRASSAPRPFSAATYLQSSDRQWLLLMNGAPSIPPGQQPLGTLAPDPAHAPS